MDSIRDGWHDLGDSSSIVTKLVVLVLLFLAAVVAERIFVRVLRRAYWRRVDRAAAARGVEELARMKRQKTLVTLLESLVRYGVYGAAFIAMLGVVTNGRATAVFGASLVVLVGFGLQRLLGDVVAGALLLFEGHFAVGDVVTVHQYSVTGTVEEFSLRTTSLRTLGGDRVTLMNGAMLSFTRWSYGQREFRVELLVRGAGAAEAVADVCVREASSATSLWIRPPQLASSEPVEGDATRCIVSAVVAPGHEVLVERLAALLEAELGSERLLGPVTHVSLYAPTFESWRSGLLLRD
jgi:hypothetical protein